MPADIHAKVAAHRTRLGGKVRRGMKEAADKLLAMSQVLVPKDTRALHDSGRVREYGAGVDWTFTVGYGGTDFPPRFVTSPHSGVLVLREPHTYAVDVHETDRKYVNGQWKYLETPLRTGLDQIRNAFRQVFVTV